MRKKFLDRAGSCGLSHHQLAVETFDYDPENWIQSWKQNYHGFPAGERFFVRPSWEEQANPDRIDLIIDPGQAFGTGTHESTQLCIRWLESHASQSTTLLDVGTGTGILSIVARKLNPQLEIVSIDNDPGTIGPALDCFRRNGDSPDAYLIGDPACLRKRFDIVVANLTLAVFQGLAATLSERVSKRIVLSGFTTDQESATADLFCDSGAFEIEGKTRLRGWSSLLLQKPVRNTIGTSP